MANFNTLRVSVRLSIGLCGATREDSFLLSDHVDEDEWANMSEDEQSALIDDITQEWANDYIDLSGKIEG